MTDAKSLSQQRDDRAALLVRSAAGARTGILFFLAGVNLPAIKETARHMARILDPRHFRVLRIPRSRQRWVPSASCIRTGFHSRSTGDLVIHEQSYYHQVAEQMLGMKKKNRQAALEGFVEDIRDFEATLCADRYVIIKVYLDRDRDGLHQDYDDLKRHVRKLIRERFQEMAERHSGYGKVMSEIMAQTDAPHARWVRPAPHADLKATKAAVLDHFIQVLEARLQVDSTAAVRDFDNAMEARRAEREAKHVET